MYLKIREDQMQQEQQHQQQQPVSDDDDNCEENVDHNKYKREIHGHNKSTIKVPLEKTEAWNRRSEGLYDLPDILIPEYIENQTCETHDNRYDPCDENLKQDSNGIVIHEENCDLYRQICVMKRPTLGECRCFQRVDGDKYLLWHLGKGRFVDYDWLWQWVLLWR